MADRELFDGFVALRFVNALDLPDANLNPFDDSVGLSKGLNQ